MWTVIYMSNNRQEAADLKKLLEGNDILTMIREQCCAEGSNYYEVLVPDTEMKEAQNLLIEEKII